MGMLLSTIWDVYGTWIILGAVIIGLVVVGVIVQRRSSRRRAKHATTAEAGASQEQLERLSEQQLLVQLVTLQREMAEHQLRQSRQLSGINTGVTVIVIIMILAIGFGCLSALLSPALLGLWSVVRLAR